MYVVIPFIFVYCSNHALTLVTTDYIIWEPEGSKQEAWCCHGVSNTVCAVGYLGLHLYFYIKKMCAVRRIKRVKTDASKYNDTHTCCLLYTLQQVFGGNEEVQQALQCITLITFLNGTKQLAKDYWCRGLKRWKDSRESTLDGRIQRFWVLEDEQRWRSVRWGLPSM